MKIKAVVIDLSNNEVKELDYDSEKWLGGRGLATRILMDHCDPACDPLGPDNAIVFAASPLTGTIAPTAGRGHAVFKSPLTGAIGSCNSGGHWGKVMKSAGVDAIVIKGAAKSPVHITITDQSAELGDRIKIKNAQDLWGKDVHETTSILTERLGKTASILAIGPAGENKVLFAALMNDKNRAYGRGGPGAVFGTKNLKAIAVSGSRKTEVADPKRLKKAVEQSRHIMKAVPATKRVLRDLGTAGLIRLINMMGILPRKNFQDCTHVETLLDQISGETLSEKILEKPGACFGCPIMCARHTRIGDKTGEGPEYETIALMGTAMDIYNLEAITLANYAANELGMDTMSLGGALACAAELFDLKAIGPSDFNGSPVRFGNAEIYPEIVHKIANRDGIGSLIADGALRMAKRIGRPETAMTVKGLEIAGYDPRGMPAQALGYMTSPTGACHLRGGYSIGLGFFGGIKEVPRFLIRQAALTSLNQHNVGIIQDSLGICRFTGYAVGLEHWARIYSSVIGKEISTKDLEHIAERIATLERMFNIRAGFSRADDDLPARFKTEPIIIDNRKRIISEDDRSRLLDDYYAERKWDREGTPTEK